MEKEIFEQAETITQTMQGRVKITPLSPMKYAVPGIDPYLMPRVRMGGLVDHVAVSRQWAGWGGGKEGGSSHLRACGVENPWVWLPAGLLAEHTLLPPSPTACPVPACRPSAAPAASCSSPAAPPSTPPWPAARPWRS